MEPGPVRNAAPQPAAPVKPPRRRLHWLWRVPLLLLVAGVLAVWLAPGWVLPPLAHYLDVSETPRPVDYVLVLNGDPETRPFAAAALVKVGLAREVLLTRQPLTLESASVQEVALLSELEITKKILESRGVPPDKVVILPGEITSTADEARTLATFLADHPQATVTVVTNGFHTRRARLVFRKFLGEDAGRVAFVGVPRDGVDPECWWQTPAGCGVYVSETCKLPYYWLRY